MTVADNINLASLEDVSSGYLVRRGAAAARARGIVSKIDIRPKNVDTISQLLAAATSRKSYWRAGSPLDQKSCSSSTNRQWASTSPPGRITVS